LRERFPDLKVRVVNVVDLMTLQSPTEHPHGVSDREFDALFTTDKPIVFAYHGYPWLIHRLTYRRNNHGNLHVRGFKEEGTTTTPRCGTGGGRAGRDDGPEARRTRNLRWLAHPNGLRPVS
jgi:xylulose-5-phosphate/fructose-6-phosphate phosphoketolase